MCVMWDVFAICVARAADVCAVWAVDAVVGVGTVAEFAQLALLAHLEFVLSCLE